MAVLTMPENETTFLLTEGPGRISRDQITLPQRAEMYPSGLVLMASGANMVPFDGSAPAAGILWLGIDASGAAQEATAITRLAEVVRSRLVFATGVTGPQEDAAIATFADSLIITRAGG